MNSRSRNNFILGMVAGAMGVFSPEPQSPKPRTTKQKKARKSAKLARRNNRRR